MPHTGKNKTCAWRKMKKQVDETGKKVRVARLYRNFILSQPTTKSYPTIQIISLMKRAGISTPVFDEKFNEARESMLKMYGKKEELGESA